MKLCTMASATITSLFLIRCRCAIKFCLTKIEKANYDKGERIEYISMHWCMININKVDVLIWRCRQNWFIVLNWIAIMIKRKNLILVLVKIILWVCEYLYGQMIHKTYFLQFPQSLSIILLMTLLHVCHHGWTAICYVW